MFQQKPGALDREPRTKSQQGSFFEKKKLLDAIDQFQT